MTQATMKDCDAAVKAASNAILLTSEVTCAQCMMILEAVVGTVVENCEPNDFNAVVDQIAESVKQVYVQRQKAKVVQ